MPKYFTESTTDILRCEACLDFEGIIEALDFELFKISLLAFRQLLTFLTWIY